MTNISVHSGSSTQHSRDFYKGTSFRYSGEWTSGVHYVCDDYIVDFVVYNNALLRCKRSHLASINNKPTDFIRDARGSIIGISSSYWDFVLAGIIGNSPGIKIIDGYWYTCDDTNVPSEEQVWINTGVKASATLSDLTEEEIEELASVVSEKIDVNIEFATREDIIALFHQIIENNIINGHIIILNSVNNVSNNAIIFDDSTNIIDNNINLY